MTLPPDRSTDQPLYQTLQQTIQVLQTATRTGFTTALPTLQQLQAQIAETVAKNTADQPVLIEVNKQLRLLMTDVMFLKSARQPATVQQRQAQIQQRLTLLQRYCGVLRGEPIDRPEP